MENAKQYSLFSEFEEAKPTPRLRMSREQKINDYSTFVEKFKPKLTTDDCYTPPEVYDAVVKFVNERVTPLAGREVVRPFWPGADYKTAQYPDGCIVIDNPPFSIYSEIVRWYLAEGIDFFLFGPSLTLANPRIDATFIIAAANIIYQNGAKVETGFVTNLLPDVRLWVCPELKQRIEAATKREKRVKQMPKVGFPYHVVSSARLGVLATHGVEWRVGRNECRGVTKACGRGIFGGGYLLSEEKRREAEEKAMVWLELTDEDLRIVAQLDHREREPRGRRAGAVQEVDRGQ